MLTPPAPPSFYLRLVIVPAALLFGYLPSLPSSFPTALSSRYLSAKVIETHDLNEVCVDAVKEALEGKTAEKKSQWDACEECKQVPWYLPLQGSLTSFSGFRMSSLGRACTHAMVSCLEAIGIAPKGR